MTLRVLHQRAGRIEAHRLGIEQGAQKGGRFMALQPAAHVGDQRKGTGMAFGKAVAGKALELFEDASGKFGGIAPFHHAAHQALTVDFQIAMAAPGRHRATQLVGLAGRVTRRHDGQTHDLFLKEGHAQRALEHLAQGFRRIIHRFQPLPPAQVRMHHVALNRPRAHDGHLNDQVVEAPGFEARQHRHLGARFHLKDAHGIGPADHVVGGLIIGRNGGRCQVAAAMTGQQIERATHAAQHAQCQAVHLQHAQHIQVVLVPLDDRALGHGGIFGGNEPCQRTIGHHEAPHVLRQVAGMVAQRFHQMEQALHQG